MQKPYKTYLFNVSIIFLLLLYGCANRGAGPQGGPKDTTAPQVIKTAPITGSLQFAGSKIDLAFDEYIVLNNPADNIIISPPQLHPPQINAYGKKIHILFQDSLDANTTYTIDFGSAIQDNNEGNILNNYTFCFSTGNNIDSLEIYGIVLDAQTLNPKKGIIVGIHSDINDTAFSALPFTRIGKSNKDGEFGIKNIKPGNYRLYALDDPNHNYAYDPGEVLAFYDDTIFPYISIKNEIDTIWKDTLINDSICHIPDSIYTSQYHYYEPSELLLLSFQEDVQQSYLVKSSREYQHCINFVFSRTQPEVPQIKFLNTDTCDFIISHTPNRDTITCWIKDSDMILMDSLQVEIQYTKSDSAYNLYLQTDTLWSVFRKSKNAKNKSQSSSATSTLNISTNIKKEINLGDTLILHCPTPIVSVRQDYLHLKQKYDTSYVNIDFSLNAVGSDSMKYKLLFDLKPQGEYELQIDSAAFKDIYSICNKSTTLKFSAKAEEDYATLYIILANIDDRAVLQLLNEKDAVVREMKSLNGKATFKYLLPGNYFLRMFIDENGDGKWTTGDFKQHRQPEQVFYLNKKLSLKANWEFEEMFDWTAVPLTEQKPKQLIHDDKKK